MQAGECSAGGDVGGSSSSSSSAATAASTTTAVSDVVVPGVASADAIVAARDAADFDGGRCANPLAFRRHVFDSHMGNVLHLCVVCLRVVCLECIALCTDRPSDDEVMSEPGQDALCIPCSAPIVRAALGDGARDFKPVVVPRGSLFD